MGGIHKKLIIKPANPPRLQLLEKTFPPGKEDKLRPEVLLYIPYKKYCNIRPNTYDILKRLPWVGVFNEGFLSRPAFLSNLIHMPCRVSFSSPILYYKLFHFRRVLRTLKPHNLLTKIKTIKFLQRKINFNT